MQNDGYQIYKLDDYFTEEDLEELAEIGETNEQRAKLLLQGFDEIIESIKV